MTDYASLTVAQLKEQLKAKGLALDGKKADLVQRLADLDSGESKPAAETETEQAPEAAKEEAPKEETKTESEPVTENGAESTEKTEEKEKPKQLSPEERKQLAVELLQKKIQRAEKFGDEQLAQAARKDLARVEKFGVDPGTALAKEIGLVDKKVNSGLGDFKRNRGNKNRNRNKNKGKNKGKNNKVQK